MMKVTTPEKTMRRRRRRRPGRPAGRCRRRRTRRRSRSRWPTRRRRSPSSSEPTMPPTRCTAMTSRLSSSFSAFLMADGEVADGAGDGADVDRRHAAHVAGARRDGDEAGDGAGGAAEGGGVAVLDLLDDEPAEHGGRGGQAGVHEAPGRPGCWRRAAEPALKPNQPNHRMPVPSSVNGRLCGGIGVVRVALALADDGHDHQRRDAGVDVDRGAAGEVEGASLEQPAGRAEHPVGERRVHQHRPEADERRRRT